MAETILSKGVDLYRDGKVRVVLSREGEFWGIVSSSDDWVTTFLDGNWRCSCPSRVTCSHIAASMLAHHEEEE